MGGVIRKYIVGTGVVGVVALGVLTDVFTGVISDVIQKKLINPHVVEASDDSKDTNRIAAMDLESGGSELFPRSSNSESEFVKLAREQLLDDMKDAQDIHGRKQRNEQLAKLLTRAINLKMLEEAVVIATKIEGHSRNYHLITIIREAITYGKRAVAKAAANEIKNEPKRLQQLQKIREVFS